MKASLIEIDHYIDEFNISMKKAETHISFQESKDRKAYEYARKLAIEIKDKEESAKALAKAVEVKDQKEQSIEDYKEFITRSRQYVQFMVDESVNLYKMGARIGYENGVKASKSEKYGRIDGEKFRAQHEFKTVGTYNDLY